jgi:hypothetical protein
LNIYLILRIESEMYSKNVLIFENQYLKMNENLKLYKCKILNSMFKNVYPMDIEHLSNINIFFKYLLNIE